MTFFTLESINPLQKAPFASSNVVQSPDQTLFCLSLSPSRVRKWRFEEVFSSPERLRLAVDRDLHRERLAPDKVSFLLMMDLLARALLRPK